MMRNRVPMLILFIMYSSVVGMQKNTTAVEGKVLVAGGVIKPRVKHKGLQEKDCQQKDGRRLEGPSWFRCKNLHVAALWDRVGNTNKLFCDFLVNQLKNDEYCAQGTEALLKRAFNCFQAHVKENSNLFGYDEIKGLVSVIDIKTRERYLINTYDNAQVYLVPKQRELDGDRDSGIMHQDQYEIIVSKALDSGVNLNCLVDKTKLIIYFQGEKSDKSELVLDSANYDEGQGLDQIIKNLYEISCVDNQQVDDTLIIVRNLQDVVNEVVDMQKVSHVEVISDELEKNKLKSPKKENNTHLLLNSQSFLVLFFFLCCMHQISSVLG